MNYKYQKWQIFGKRLKVPKDILNKVYNCTLSFNEYIEYQLDDKIPTSCIIESDRKIVERFGIDKCKELDWELINKRVYYNNINFRDVLMSIDSKTDDINQTIYEQIKNQIKPSEYSSKMKEVYSDRLLDPSLNNEESQDLIRRFNDGEVDIQEIIKNWDLFKNKDLSFCLLKDKKNINHIPAENLKLFMTNYANLASLIVENKDIYTFIPRIFSMKTEEEKQQFMKQFADEILSNTKRRYDDSRQYKELFKYTSMEEYLKKYNESAAVSIIEQLKNYPKDYIFNMPIPFVELTNDSILYFVEQFGLKNVIDFDNENNHFFTKNNCEFLKKMKSFLKYSGNEKDPEQSIHYDKDGKYIWDYTKENFYEAMRKLMQYGSSGHVMPDFRYIEGVFREKNPQLFISEQAPKELQEFFYNKEITPQILLEHPEYVKFLKEKNIASCFKEREIILDEKNQRNEYYYVNFYQFLSKKTNFNGVINFVLEYSDFLDAYFDNRKDYSNSELLFSQEDDIEKIKTRINESIKRLIVEKGIKYPKKIPESFIKKYPRMFLGIDASIDLKKLFYNRELSVSDFIQNPKLMDHFNNTNIACGFPSEMTWIINLFQDYKSVKESNAIRFKSISEYSKIPDAELRDTFKEYLEEFEKKIDIKKIDFIADILNRLLISNSSEIYEYKKELATQLLNSENPLDSLKKIVEVFEKNNVPTVGKIYACFEILHPNFEGFSFSESSLVSPVLANSSTMGKKAIIFSDLLKSTFGSNNKSVNDYLKNIEFGSNLYESIKLGQIQFDSLGETEMRELTTFCNHLATLYNNTMKAKVNNDIFKTTGNVFNDILELSKKLSPDGTLDYNIGDRVIKMFCGFTGIKTLEQAKEYVERKVKTADSRNRNASSSDMVLEQGDFIKGIKPFNENLTDLEACIRVLPKILQNGSNSKEFLASNVKSDRTPLDTDVAMIMSSDGTISEKIGATVAADYGPIWFVLKNDDRFITTRNKNGSKKVDKDMSKLEVFYTGIIGDSHYGIRTGFASSEINYIVMDNYDPRVGLEIAMNGFYIPVANKEGKIVFTPKDYDKLRTKMSGLSYYGMPDYNLSKNLISEEILETKEKLIQDIKRTNAYASEIKGYICDAVKYAGIMNVVDGFNSDLTQGIAEIYSTGSTSRNTNVPNDSDFDYLIKVDRTIYFNPSKLETFKSKMKTKLGFTDEYGGKICGKIKKDTGDELDVEISFCPRTDKVELSTDTSLSSKLDAIKNQYPDSYMDVLANIVYAKELFKSINAYKSLKSDATQGGLGGIGIENWILQHGGSFYDAAKDFVNEAKKAGSFEEFKKVYQVFDLGDNHYSDKSGVYPHDNFVGDENKMGQDGYNRMLTTLKEYLKYIELAQMNTETIKR